MDQLPKVPVSDDAEIELRQYLLVLQQWWWLIAGCAITAAVMGFIVSSASQPVYRATATLLVQQAPSSGVIDYTALLTSERLAQTYAQMVTGRPVLEMAIQQRGLNMTPEELAKMVRVELVRNTQLIRINVEHTDPAEAARIANIIAESFTAYIQTLQQQRYGDSLDRLKAQLDELSRLMYEAQGQLDALKDSSSPQAQVERARLEMSLAGYRSSYTSLLQSYEQMRLTTAQHANTVSVFEAAQAPEEPIRPRKLMNAALAGVIGTMLAVVGVFLREYLDDTVKTPDDIARTTSLSVLGMIGRLTGGEKEQVAWYNPLSPIAEDFRKLRANIRYASVDRPLRTLSVTSPTAAEGKSFTVANLAIVFAQAGLRVMVIDGDLRRPRQHLIFQIPPKGGLVRSLVDGGTDIQLQATEVKGLVLLPAGDRPPNPAELLGSTRMRELLRRLAGEADMVLVDCPPVLPVADVMALAREVDGVLLVVQAGVTRRPALRQALESLQQVGARVIGVVLNGIPTHKGGYYYHYYHAEYDDGKDKKAKGRLQRIR